MKTSSRRSMKRWPRQRRLTSRTRMRETIFSCNEVNGSEANRMAKKRKPNPKMQEWIDAREAPSPLPRPSADGSRVGYEPDQARQTGQSSAGIVENAAEREHRALLPETVRKVFSG